MNTATCQLATISDEMESARVRAETALYHLRNAASLAYRVRSDLAGRLVEPLEQLEAVVEALVREEVGDALPVAEPSAPECVPTPVPTEGPVKNWTSSPTAYAVARKPRVRGRTRKPR